MNIENKEIKPLTMTISELKNKIETAIAKSGLPACLIEPIICNYYLQLKSASEAQTRAEKERYDKETSKREEK